MPWEWYLVVCTCKQLRVKTISSVSKSLKCNGLNAKRSKRLSVSSTIYCFMLVMQIHLKAFIGVPDTDVIVVSWCSSIL